ALFVTHALRRPAAEHVQDLLRVWVPVRPVPTAHGKRRLAEGEPREIREPALTKPPQHAMRQRHLPRLTGADERGPHRPSFSSPLLSPSQPAGVWGLSCGCGYPAIPPGRG